MAIAFELVADFGSDKESSERFLQWITPRIQTVIIDGYSIDIHKPLLAGYPFVNPTNYKVSVIPANVGIAVAIDDARDRIPLDSHQLSQLGEYMYHLLRGAPEYQLAMVGWDIDFILDINELNEDWTQEIIDGSLSGIVIDKMLIHRLPASSLFVNFDDRHVWIPYSGSQSIK